METELVKICELENETAGSKKMDTLDKIVPLT